MFRSWRRRYWLGRKRIPAWAELLAQVPLADGLSAQEASVLHDLTVVFLHEKAIHGVRGFELTPDMRALIAVQACIPVLRLGIDCYDGWVEVLVYPAGFRAPRRYHDEAGVEHHGFEDLAGEAWERGPVILSWEDIAEDLAEPGYGHNVVVHEMAHKLDALDGAINGLPLLHPRMPLAAWSAACETAYRDLGRRAERGEPTAIDPYAASDPGEFFAVMSEAFFDAPDLLEEAYPAVYEQFTLFYRQDPLARLAPAEAQQTDPPPSNAH